MSTIIIGGGIIGLSTAYWLSIEQPEKAAAGQIHIVDSAPSLLLSASGFAGGFLAKDWFSPGVARLGALSYQLHEQLADEHDGYKKWGYAKSTAYSLSVDEVGVGGKKTGKKIKGEDWLLEGTSRAEVAMKAEPGVNGGVVENGKGAERHEMLNDDGTPAWITKQEGGTLDVISGDDSCAQVEPRELCEWLQQECETRGVVFHLSCKPVSVRKDTQGRLSGIVAATASGNIELDGSNIVIAAGAWTPRVFKTFFPDSKTRIGIKPLAGYSIVVRSPRYSRPIDIPAKYTKSTGMCHAVFCGPGPDWACAPEAISRMTRDGRPEVYVAGLNDSNMPLPPDTTAVKGMKDKDKMKELRKTTVYLTGLSKEGEDSIEDDLVVVREGLCFRPVSDSGRPVVTKLTGKQLGQGVALQGDGGVYVASGHGPWGISLGPGTGFVVAEMVQGKKTSVDVSRLGVS